MKKLLKINLLIIVLSVSFLLCVTGQPTYDIEYVYTPIYNSQVTVKRLTSSDWNSTQKASIRAVDQATYPNNVFMSDASLKYNCHAYAWLITQGGIERWMDSPGDDAFFSEYIEVPQSEATKVSYGSEDHSAITTGTTDLFISKWGSGCLWQHSKYDSPYSISDLHFYVLPYITGPYLVCSSGAEFTVNNLPSGATITWSQTQGLTRISDQGSNPCEFEATENGTYGWISATVTYNGNEYTLRVKTVWLGAPVTPTYISKYTETEPLCLNTLIHFYCDEVGEPTIYYNWTVTSYSADIYYGQGTTFITAYPYYGGDLTFSVAAQNECGSSDNIYSDAYYIEDCSFKFTLYPNPATSYLTIQLPEIPAENAIVDVYNSQSVKIISITMADKEKTIDISKLQKGVYYITVVSRSKGKVKSSTERFIKE